MEKRKTLSPAEMVASIKEDLAYWEDIQAKQPDLVITSYSKHLEGDGNFMVNSISNKVIIK